MNGHLLSEPECYDLLNRYDIRVPDYCLSESVGEALSSAEKIGYPVVLKIVSPDISHKSDVGGVVTGISSPEELESEYESLLIRINKRIPDAEISGVLVSEHVEEGPEVIIGGKLDSVFGRVITFGTGGTLVELIKDISVRLLPVDRTGISEMIDKTKISAIIGGYRGGEEYDRSALEEIIADAARMFLENEDIISFDINPLILHSNGAVAVDARIIISDEKIPADTPASTPPLLSAPEKFTSPQSIAVIGASSSPGKLGYYLMHNLLPFSGDIYPVNPRGGSILGKEVFKNISDIPVIPDWAVIVVPAKSVPQVMRDAGEKGIKSAVIISAGFKEAGYEGAKLEEEVVSIAKEYGIRFAGPNCLGIMLPYEGINATFGQKMPKPGPVAFISQSGAIITAAADRGIVGNTGLSTVISVGNQADLNFSDYLGMLLKDCRTKAAVFYIEGLKPGREFTEMAGKHAKELPVIVLKAGKTEMAKKAAMSHTGSLAGSYEIYKEAFREAGIINAFSLSSAFSVAGLLASEGWPKGRRAVVVTSGGGFAVLSADFAGENGITLIPLPERMKEELDKFMPEGWSGQNPVDIIGDAGAERYARALDILIRYQDFWDIAFVAASPVTSIDPIKLAKEIVRFSKQTGKMVVGCMISGESMQPGISILNENHIPNFAELYDAFKAVGLALEAGEGAGIFDE
ncbi:acetate--CoA ligase family protein [Methanoplanus endosymbiosus]|uniref:acetate--CoA ligase (ADP-forming) n=1 Tax=Methanoplanus endosymbiosus TaxID=33865 RepID=A0A9E7PK21_9EURY|nr:acetate--CoA ligase family protein [Methanoplanus endosymbiosus]UUX91353.1 acetate--CoA ligase family protein [Methanoplanus endosymbiosus]